MDDWRDEEDSLDLGPCWWQVVCIYALLPVIVCVACLLAPILEWRARRRG